MWSVDRSDIINNHVDMSDLINRSCVKVPLVQRDSLSVLVFDVTHSQSSEYI